MLQQQALILAHKTFLVNFTENLVIFKCLYILCEAGHTLKKRLAVLPSPAGMSLTKLSLGGNNWIIPGQEEVVSDMPVRDGKTKTFFNSALSFKIKTIYFYDKVYFSMLQFDANLKKYIWLFLKTLKLYCCTTCGILILYELTKFCFTLRCLILCR